MLGLCKALTNTIFFQITTPESGVEKTKTGHEDIDLKFKTNKQVYSEIGKRGFSWVCLLILGVAPDTWEGLRKHLLSE